MGTRALRKIQIGLESAIAQGDPVDATAALLGVLTMKETPTIHRPVEERGTLAEFGRSVKVANLAELTFEGDVTFEQIIYLLLMGVLGGIDPDNELVDELGAAWEGLTEYDVGDMVTPTAPNGYQYKCTTAGTSGAEEPTWGTTIGGITSDGATLKWTCLSRVWVTAKAYALGDLVAPTTPNGYRYKCTTAGTSSTPEPTWGTTLGGITADGATLKWTCCANKLWTFTPNLDVVGVFDSFTIEYGDDITAWETEFVMAKSIEISFGMAEAMRVKAELFGRKMTETDFTPSITPPSVESVIGQKAKLYIDDENGTIGATEMAATIIGATYGITTGLVPKRYGDGSIDFSTYGEAFKGVELKMTVAFNSGMAAERAKFDGETLRLVRIQASGSYEKRFTLDFCGLITDWATLSEREGEDIVEITLSPQLGGNYTKLFEIVVVNALATLPS